MYYYIENLKTVSEDTYIVSKYHTSDLDSISDSVIVSKDPGQWFSDDIGFQRTKNSYSNKNIRLVKRHIESGNSRSVFWLDDNGSLSSL